MATMHEHRENTASILTALGRIPANATQADIDAAVEQALDDEDILARSTELLYRLGAGNLHYPAAA
jgi:hypothetical protein